MSIRIGVAAFMQESNSFAPRLAELEDFVVHTGPAVLQNFRDTNSEIGGFLDACAAEQWEPVPLLSAAAISGGPLSRECFEKLCAQLVTLVMSQRLDGLLLALHGAMSVEDIVSGDAEVARRLRNALGRQIPIAVSHDLHANVTPDLLRHVNGVSGYRTYPHVDQRDTGHRAGAMLKRLLHGEKSFHLYLPIPVLLSPPGASTFDGPLKSVMDALAYEFREADATYATLFCVQPWLDFEPVRSTLVVTQFGPDPGLAARMHRIAASFWSVSRQCEVQWTSPEHLLETVYAIKERPVLVSESTDAPTGGASGDHTGLLQCLLPVANKINTCIYLVDPPMVELAGAKGVGRDLQGLIGASIDNRFSRPVALSARVERLSEGDFVARGPAFHGCRFSMGRTAVLRAGRLQIVVASRPVVMIDPELYRSQQIEPGVQGIVGIKSPLLFRAAYEAISTAVVHLDLPGPCRGRLSEVQFTKINRPLRPLDEWEWTPPEPDAIFPSARE